MKIRSSNVWVLSCSFTPLNFEALPVASLGKPPTPSIELYQCSRSCMHQGKIMGETSSIQDPLLIKRYPAASLGKDMHIRIDKEGPASIHKILLEAWMQISYRKARETTLLIRQECELLLRKVFLLCATLPAFLLALFMGSCHR